MVKTCSRCRADLPLEEFYRSSSGSHGRGAYCKACVRDKQRERNERPEVSEQNRARAREWGRANRDRQAANSRRMREHRPEAQRVYSAAHRARRYWCESTLTYEEWLAIGEAHGWRCVYCGAPHESIDHVVPLAAGGPNSADNVVPSCLSCNCGKDNQGRRKEMT